MTSILPGGVVILCVDEGRSPTQKNVTVSDLEH